MKVCLTIRYDGTAFKGWAPNHNIRSVSQDLTSVIQMVTRSDSVLTVAGRTDAGVHALGQVVSFPVRDDFSADDLHRLVKSINSLCAPSISVADSKFVGDEFDARRSATSRHYRYLLSNGRYPDPFLANRAWHVHGRLDLVAMQAASALLVGEHDFAAFCRLAPPPNNSTVRHVFFADWSVGLDGLWQFEISGNAFCHQQVRAIVGTLVIVGRGELVPADVEQMLVKKDRVRMPDLAPAHGLYLTHVGYGGKRVHP